MKVSVHTVKRNAKKVEISLRRAPAVKVVTARAVHSEDVPELFEQAVPAAEEENPVQNDTTLDELLEEIIRAEDAEAEAAKEELDRAIAEEEELARLIAEEEELARRAAEEEELARMLAEEQQHLDDLIEAEEKFLDETAPEESDDDPTDDPIGAQDDEIELDTMLFECETSREIVQEIAADSDVIAQEIMTDIAGVADETIADTADIADEAITDTAQEVFADTADIIEDVITEDASQEDEYADVGFDVFSRSGDEYLPFGHDEDIYSYESVDADGDGVPEKGIFRRFLDRCRLRSSQKDAEGVEYICVDDDSGKMSRVCGVMKKHKSDDETDDYE